MSLYQTSVLKKYLKGIDRQTVDAAYSIFITYFHNPAIQENIRNAKEEQFQEGFLRELFVKVFGYTLNPNPDYNLTTEFRNLKGAKKADGAILQGGKAIAVLELKGTDTTNLDKIEAQAFGYKSNQPGCQYVVTSNFEKLRFYIDNTVDFEEFNLFALNKERFDLLWLCLAQVNVLKALPKRIKEDSVMEEENVTKKLYKDYSAFKSDIFQSIVEKNPQHDKLLLFKKTQKLLDRFLFIFFAEDRLLLPPNSIRLIIDQWMKLRDELDAYTPLYDRFKKYFGYMNTGHKGAQHEIFAYNGGLFEPDELLDNIKIADDLLYKHTLNLSHYDFESEVDVNILGHIFEHSLNEIEEITAELEGQAIDKSKTKRKKDGVFYTPKYITKYIVENTVGKLCEEKKAELEIVEEEYHKDRKGRKKDTLKRLENQLNEYRQWLLGLTICDPACGSGAFLNQALEFLIDEHRYVDELNAKLFEREGENLMVFQDVSNDILEKNLYGVDINEESVEIAKLSLWLRTAQKGRKLSVLSNNIKCGNSLIDDPAVAGDKAFHWESEFPHVFRPKDKQAFHVVLTTHNSRTSQRMLQLGIVKGTPVELGLEEEIALTKIIGTIIADNGYHCLAYNICKDHIHLLLVCEQEELTGMVQKIKSMSSKLFHRSDIPMGHDPLDHGNHLWSQKFFRAEMDVWQLATLSHRPGYLFQSSHLDNALVYVRNNRIKHDLPDSADLQQVIDGFCTSQEVAFQLKYKGGFDVVIGNPPYVKLEVIKNISQQLEKANFQTFDKRGDLYVLFVEKGFNVLKPNGLISYIMPNKWLQAGYGKSLRTYFLTKRLNQLIDFGDIQIFQGATTYPLIFVAQDASPNKQVKIAVLKSATATDFNTIVDLNTEEFNTHEFSEETWVISSLKSKSLLNRLNKKFISLNEFINGNANYGIKTGLTEAFIISEETNKQILIEDPKSKEIIKPVLRGRDIQRWAVSGFQVYLIGTFPALNISIDKYPAIKNHFLAFGKERLRQSGKKGSRKKTNNQWFETQDTIGYWKDFQKPKIMYQKFQVKPCFIYDEQGLYCNDSMWIIPTNNKGLVAILNSKMGWWLITKYCTQIQNGCQLIWKYFGQIPIPNINDRLYNLVDIMIEKSKALKSLSGKFEKTISRKFELEKLSNNLENWHTLTYSEFLKELKKQKVKLSLSEEAEWEEYFEVEKAKAQAIQQQINETDREIDQMVYELYGLTEEEIRIVEHPKGSSKGS